MQSTADLFDENCSPQRLLRLYANLLQNQSIFVQLRVRFIVFAGIFEHEHKIRCDLIDGFVHLSFQLVGDFFHINGILDDVVIVRIVLQ